MKKQELRKIYLKKRLELSPEGYDELNGKLLDQFKKTDLSGIQYIHFFLPIRERKEPDTFLMIDWLKQNHPQIKLVYPKADFAKNTMTHFLDDDELLLADNEFGIPEPLAGNQIDTLAIDMVIVPLLAFDEQGYRVGYGKGFYDRFMAECKPSVLFVGLSFFGPVNAIDDIDAHDIKLHQCITPEKLWIFNK